jgi:hypothetical protein
LTTQREDPLNLGRFAGKSAPGGVAKNLMLSFHMGWVREVVSRYAQPNKAKIYYISPDKGTKLRSSKDAVRYFLNYPHDNLSAENFSWKQKALGLNDPLIARVQTAKPQSPRGRGVPLMNLQPPIFDDDSSPAFDVNEVYHVHPGDIQEDSWGIVKTSEDVNANTRDFEAEQKAFEHAKSLREGYEHDERFHTGHVEELGEDGLVQQIINIRARNVDIQSRSAEKAQKGKAAGLINCSPESVMIKHDHNDGNSDDFPDIAPTHSTPRTTGVVKGTSHSSTLTRRGATHSRPPITTIPKNQYRKEPVIQESSLNHHATQLETKKKAMKITQATADFIYFMFICSIFF